MRSLTAVQKLNCGKNSSFHRSPLSPQCRKTAIGAQRTIIYQESYQIPGAASAFVSQSQNSIASLGFFLIRHQGKARDFSL
jgi:hypothetical protein